MYCLGIIIRCHGDELPCPGTETHKNWRSALRSRRAGQGSAVLHAETGIEAVELCKKEDSISLILMDIKLPEIDGFEATKQIRKFNKNITIIGQTAYALVGDRKKVIEAGCDDYISKPIDMKDLIEMINTHF